MTQPHDRHKDELKTAITYDCLEDQKIHFTPRRRYGGLMGGIWRDGRPVTVRGYFILGSNCQDFYNVSIRKSFVSTYHWIILAELRGFGT